MTSATSTCTCGTFTTTITGSFGDVRYCHCSRCRSKTGTAFTANAKIHRSQWHLDGPPQSITEFEHTPGLYNAFCSRCGTPLYARSDQDPNDIRIRIGGFQGNIDVTITGHVWVNSKATWYEIEDSLRQFDEAYVDASTD
ncbi:MAG: GFA family protein [Pseudomonadales bacterium]|nr:GFA family protein [Pseudomonadales bacterium]